MLAKELLWVLLNTLSVDLGKRLFSEKGNCGGEQDLPQAFIIVAFCSPVDRLFTGGAKIMNMAARGILLLLSSPQPLLHYRIAKPSLGCGILHPHFPLLL